VSAQEGERIGTRSGLGREGRAGGFGMGESPRWHEGRLWFSNWGTNEIVAVDLEGNSKVIGAGGGGSGWAVSWLRDGRMLVSGGELLRVEPDGTRVRHADLRHVSPSGRPSRGRSCPAPRRWRERP
jgi:sugar lactone lactonase YvrE